MMNVSQALGFVYTDMLLLEPTHAALFARGCESGKIFNVLSGSPKGFPVRIYNFTDPTKTSVGYTVCEITYPFDLTHVMVLTKETIEGFVTGMDIPNWAAIHLEGDFNKYFSVYSERNFEIEAEELLTPEVMEQLIDGGRRTSVELCDNKLFVFKNWLILSPQDMSSLYNTAMFLAPLAERLRK